MPQVRLEDGTLVTVDLNNILSDDGQTPFVPPAPTQTFTAADLERVRQEEKDKLYSRLESTTSELTALREQVGSLTAAEEARRQELEAEQARLAEQAEQERLASLDPTERIEARLEEQQRAWQTELQNLQQSLETERTLREKEQQFHELGSYIQQQVAAHTQGEDADIAPELAGWINGNTQEEVDASIARAVETTQRLVEQFQQLSQQQVVVDPNTGQPIQVVQEPQQVVAPQAPAMVAGVRATGGPANFDPAGAASQTLTPEQIQNMPMSEWAKQRQRLIGAASSQRNQGLFG